MKSMCLTTTITVSVISLVILFCHENSFVAYAQKIKTNEGTEYHYDRKMMCEYFSTPSRLDQYLYANCKKKRKRILTDENILQSHEKARSFLQKTTRDLVTNYAMFMEECCVEGCRVEEIFEHCNVLY